VPRTRGPMFFFARRRKIRSSCSRSIKCSTCGPYMRSNSFLIICQHLIPRNVYRSQLTPEVFDMSKTLHRASSWVEIRDTQHSSELR
jgi:hypothetical protein